VEKFRSATVAETPHPGNAPGTLLPANDLSIWKLGEGVGWEGIQREGIGHRASGDEKASGGGAWWMNSSTMSHSDRFQTFQPIAGVLACLFPGLGHWYLDGIRRGGLVCVGVMGLFVGGMLIGGVDVIDRKRDQWWFVLQAGVGPTAFGVDWWREGQVRGAAGGGVGGWRGSAGGGGGGMGITTSLGKVNEVGSLYAGMAGLLNLIAIIDGFWNLDRGQRRRARGPTGGGGSASSVVVVVADEGGVE